MYADGMVVIVSHMLRVLGPWIPLKCPPLLSKYVPISTLFGAAIR